MSRNIYWQIKQALQEERWIDRVSNAQAAAAAGIGAGGLAAGLTAGELIDPGMSRNFSKGIKQSLTNKQLLGRLVRAGGFGALLAGSGIAAAKGLRSYTQGKENG